MFWHFFHLRTFRWHNRPVRVILVIHDLAIELVPFGSIHMATRQKVGQSIAMTIEYLDQNGQPMATQPSPDSAPVWANTSSSTETLTASPSGSSAVALAIAAGSDTVRVQLMVGGVNYQATLDVTVEAAVSSQTLTSIGIVAATPTP